MMMQKLAMVTGVAYVVLGLWVAIYPEGLVSVVDWESRHGLLIAAGIRVAVGLVLILAASASRFPTAFRVIGGIALTAGLLMPLIPIDFWAEYMQWWMVENLTLFRAVLAAAATLGGAFIVYTALPRRAAA